MNRCPRCGADVTADFVVCHGCGYLPAAQEEFKLQPATERASPATIPSDVLQDVEEGTVRIKEPIEIEPDNFTEYILPWLLIAMGIGPNIYLSILLAGVWGPLALALDIAALLFVEIPLTVGILMAVGLLFGINFGWLSTGILKLAAIAIFVRGLFALSYTLYVANFPAAAAIAGGLALLSFIWLLMRLFDLDVSETVICCLALLVSLSLLQYSIYLLIGALVRQPVIASILLETCRAC